MFQIKNIVIITIIGLSLLISGCTDKTDTKTQEETAPIQTAVAQNTISQTPTGETPSAEVLPYQVLIIEKKTLKDCIVAYGQKTDCYFINLEIKNNEKKALSVTITKDYISTKTTKTFDRYVKEVGLSKSCFVQLGLESNETASRNIGMCYPVVSEKDDPVLNLEMIINKKNEKYTFDLK